MQSWERSFRPGAALAGTLACALLAQSTGNREFAAASIKPNKARTIIMGVRQLSHGRVITENTPLRFLIGVAYKRRLGWFEISGGPGWIDSDGYDITAKADGDATNEQMYPMLQTLLRERFQLRLHRETRELPVYVLSETKGGLKLLHSNATPCLAGAPGTQPPPQPGKPLVLPCGDVALSLSPLGLRLTGGQTSMERFAAILSGALGRTVVDKTGFTGTFEVDVEFTPDDSVAGIPRPGLPGALPSPTPTGDSAGPSLSSALQEQLGLKLTSARGPVTVLVIDHVARPTPN